MPADLAFLADQHLGARRDREAGQLCQNLGRLAHAFGVHRLASGEDHLGQTIGLCRGAEIGAGHLQSLTHVAGNLRVSDHRLFGHARCTIVKAFGRDDHFGHFIQFTCHRFVHVAGHIARSYRQRRLTAGIGCLDHGRAARRHHHRSAAVFHQLGRALDRDRIEALDKPLGRAHLVGHAGHDAHNFIANLHPTRMWGADNRVARFDCTQNLENYGRGRVGHRDQRGHHAHRLTKGRDLGRIVTPETTKRGDIPQPVRRAARVHQIFYALVFGIAIAGLLDRHPTQPRAFRFDRFGHGLHDGVHMRRIGSEELLIGLEGLFRTAAGGSDGFQIGIHLATSRGDAVHRDAGRVDINRLDPDGI